jgi:putative transposase
MVRSFPNIVKQILKGLPTNDYPVLHSCLFFPIWLTCILDKSLTSMRDLFYLLNRNVSTFSKACKQRCDQYFRSIYTKLRQKLIHNNPTAAKMLFPIDSTVITLTSKLFWVQGQHQVKLLNGVNVSQGYVSECLIDFGQGHDARFTDYIASMIPENGIGIMDRGFASWKFLDELSATNTLFVVRVRNLIIVGIGWYGFVM